MISRPSLNSFPTRKISLLKLPSPTLVLLLVLPVLSFSVLACIAAALSAVPGEPVGGTLILGGSTGPDLVLEAPESVEDWVLVPSEVNERQVLLIVTARTGSILAVSSSARDGRMAQFDPETSGYPDQGRSLLRPMTISSPGSPSHPDSWKVVLPESGAIHQGDATSGQQVVVVLQQPVSWEDEPPPEGQVYRMDLTFTLSPSG